MSLSRTLTALLSVWSVYDRALKRVKKQELDLRKEIETKLLEAGYVPNEIGVFRIDLGDEDLKLTRKESRSFKYDTDKATWLFKKLGNYFQEQEKGGYLAIDIIKQLFKAEMVTDIKGYDMLSDDLKKLVNESGMLEIKDAQSTLEIVAKAKPKFEG